MADDTPNKDQAIARVPLKATDERAMAIIPRDFEGAYRMAQVVVAGKMAPKSFEEKDGSVSVERICICIMHGLEVGFTPMAALQSIAVVNGMPTIWGDGMIALVRRSGLLESIHETVELDDKNEPAIAVCRVRRKGDKHEIVGSFTSVEAQRAGLWNKAGPWQQYRTRMMKMRARSWALRDAFPDVLRGLHQTEEALDTPLDVTAQGEATIIPPEPKRSDVKTPAAPPTSEPDTAAATTPQPPAAAAPAATAPASTPSAGSSSEPASEMKRNWSLPPSLVGQAAVLKALDELLEMTANDHDLDELLSQNSERVAKITGSPRLQWNAKVSARRQSFRQGGEP